MGDVLDRSHCDVSCQSKLRRIVITTKINRSTYKTVCDPAVDAFGLINNFICKIIGSFTAFRNLRKSLCSSDSNLIGAMINIQSISIRVWRDFKGNG